MKLGIVDFLKGIFEEIEGVGIGIKSLKIDHVAYSCESSEEYEKFLPQFVKTGKLIKEAIISDRRVAIIKLDSPIKYNNYIIGVTELIEPIKKEESLSGWEHVEFLVDDYDSFLEQYPKLNWNLTHKNRESFSRIKLVLPSGKEVKFLNTPALVSAELES